MQKEEPLYRVMQKEELLYRVIKNIGVLSSATI
jgi:hypothetical protein